MAGASTRRDLKALYRLIDQADLVLATIADPHPSLHSARESLHAAIALSKDIIKRSDSDALPSTAAAALGAKGGNATAARGSEYYRQLAAKRKTKGGGRPHL